MSAHPFLVISSRVEKKFTDPRYVTLRILGIEPLLELSPRHNSEAEMRIYLGIITVILGSLLGLESASAQRVEDLPRGAKVRVLMHGGVTSLGYIDTVTTEAISLHVFAQNPDGDRLQLQRNLVTQMHVLRKTPGKGIARGALYGLVVGAGTGFLIGALTYSESDCDILACSPSSAGAFASIWGGVIGIPAGMIWGSSRQKWEEVALRRQ